MVWGIRTKLEFFLDVEVYEQGYMNLECVVSSRIEFLDSQKGVQGGHHDQVDHEHWVIYGKNV